MAEKGRAGLFSLRRRERGAEVGAGTIVVNPYGEKRLNVLDIGEGVKIPKPGATTDAYSPYAEAWKEFDKLKKRAKGSGALSWMHWVWAQAIFAIPLFAPHRIPRKDSILLAASVAVLGAIQLVRAQHARNQFKHWQCPRCHAEWPGTKTEKDGKCVMCGLRLHQTAP